MLKAGSSVGKHLGQTQIVQERLAGMASQGGGNYVQDVVLSQVVGRRTDEESPIYRLTSNRMLMKQLRQFYMCMADKHDSRIPMHALHTLYLNIYNELLPDVNDNNVIMDVAIDDCNLLFGKQSRDATFADFARFMVMLALNWVETGEEEEITDFVADMEERIYGVIERDRPWKPEKPARISIEELQRRTVKEEVASISNTVVWPEAMRMRRMGKKGPIESAVGYGWRQEHAATFSNIDSFGSYMTVGSVAPSSSDFVPDAEACPTRDLQAPFRQQKRLPQPKRTQLQTLEEMLEAGQGRVGKSGSARAVTAEDSLSELSGTHTYNRTIKKSSLGRGTAFSTNARDVTLVPLPHTILTEPVPLTDRPKGRVIYEKRGMAGGGAGMMANAIQMKTRRSQLLPTLPLPPREHTSTGVLAAITHR
eukprot:CAMPEP_0113907754 /NCGR_PEP_ID=MMETSP0780_2-20120614/25695_1 /TAXON_ID=652834 /ORGANISM="Palpitomonas bilix" /LENGTH=421 /DNA_ID=CAMNT_0000902933 /DNA_START=311 /DNA_END=1576 /DNA_ORIENTATION=+ /assembly_acc=CAM_ASM_000599